MRRPARTWWAFAACAALVLSALGWITHLALGLETREREARAQARFQETLRIALLRMDSALAPLIAREAARPYFHYAPFYAEELAFQNVRPSLAQAEVLVPSPLLRERHDLFRLHFQISPDGQFTSPQAPVGDQCDAAVGNAICPAPAVAEARELLARVSSFVRREEVLPELSRGAPWGGAG